MGNASAKPKLDVIFSATDQAHTVENEDFRGENLSTEITKKVDLSEFGMQRADERIRFHGEVEIHENVEINGLVAVCENISLGGAGVVIKGTKEFTIGQKLQIAFQSIPGLAGRLIEVEVMHFATLNVGHTRMGLRFVKLTQLVEKSLDDLIDKLHKK